MNYLVLLLSFIFGTVIGSFLNVVILRLPKDMRLTGRSFCPHCRHTLGALELIPLVSFIALGGKCKNCKHKISPRYFIIEVLAGLLFLLASVYFYPSSPLAALLLLKAYLIIAIAIAVFVMDLENLLIFDSVLIFGSVGALLLTIIIDVVFPSSINIWHSATVWSVVAALVCPLPFFLLWYFSGGRWMGFGDVKLAVFLGLGLGWPLGLLTLLIGVFLGGAVGILLLLGGKKNLTSKVPFGSFLSIAAVICLFWGGFLLNWYLGFLGLGR